MTLFSFRGVENGYLQAPSGTVLRYDADVRRVDAGPDEASQMVELNVSHLKITTHKHTATVSATLSNITFPNPMETEDGGGRTDGSFMYKVLRITLPAVHQNNLFAVG